MIPVNSVLLIEDNSVRYLTKIEDRSVLPCNYTNTTVTIKRVTILITARSAVKEILTDKRSSIKNDDYLLPTPVNKMADRVLSFNKMLYQAPIAVDSE